MLFFLFSNFYLAIICETKLIIRQHLNCISCRITPSLHFLFRQADFIYYLKFSI